jgi:ketosteroid isomerase-like protein
MWCVYGPDGSKLGEFQTRAEADARVAEAKEAMQEPFRAAGADPAIERVIKHEDGKWCVYSESGRKLGEHDSKEDAEKQLQAIEIEKHKDEKGASQPTRYGIAEVAGQFAVWDAERDTFTRFATREAAEHRLAALIQVSGEQPYESTALQRLEIVTQELTRAQAAEKEALTRLAAAERKVIELENTPARERPVKYGGHALERTFLANLGSEADAAVARLRKEYADAEAVAKAERQGDVDKRTRALERMLRCQGELAEHGVFL